MLAWLFEYSSILIYLSRIFPLFSFSVILDLLSNLSIRSFYYGIFDLSSSLLISNKGWGSSLIIFDEVPLDYFFVVLFKDDDILI